MLAEYITEAYYSMKNNKMRVFLTVFGVAIGAWLIIMIITIGDTFKLGVKDYFNKAYSSISRVVTCGIYEVDENGEEINSKKYSLTEIEIAEYLKNAPSFILDLIRESDYEVKGILKTETGTKIGNVNMAGVSKGYFFYDNLSLVCGRFISERDCIEIKSTVVLTKHLAQNMFGKSENALGKNVYLIDKDNNVINLIVVGVIEDGRKNSEMKGEYETQIYCSYSYMNLCYGTEEDNLIEKFRVIVKDSDYLERASVYTNSFLKGRFQNYKNYKYKVRKFNMYDRIDTLINVVTAFFVIISLTSLVVGGIGTANIMLASVVERTREIGIKRAVGATQIQIHNCFIMEAGIICLTAGILSIILGDVTCIFITKNINSIIQLIGMEKYHGLINKNIVLCPSLTSKIVAVSFSFITGIIAGYIPAKKASKMEPVKALRFD